MGKRLSGQPSAAQGKYRSRLETVARLALLVTVGLAAGCSQVIPGLNVDASGGHEYSIVKDDGAADQYKVVGNGSSTGYTLVDVTPDVVLALARQQPEAGAESAELRSLLPSDVPPEYRLGPGDVFFPIVWDHPELTQPTGGASTADPATQGRLVDSTGMAFYPFVGTFKAAGMTAGELRNYLTDSLKKYIEKPQVDVRVVSFRANRIEVTGEVQRPATLTIDDAPKGILQAISACGGLTTAASRRRAILVRKNRIYKVDLAGLLSGNQLVGNPALEPGDVLHFPDQSHDQVFMLGAVDKQQPVVIQQGALTLIQALTVAGGLDNLRANQSGVLIFRMNDVNDQLTATVFKLDMGRPEGVLLASAFQLQPRDVVFVKATAFAQYNSVIQDILPTVQTLFYLLEIKNITN